MTIFAGSVAMAIVLLTVTFIVGMWVGREEGVECAEKHWKKNCH